MRKLEGEQLRIRVFIGESDLHHGRPLYQALVELLRKEHMAGATVLRGILGFGAKSHMHAAHLLALSQDMPLVIEVVDTQEHIDNVLPKVEAMMEDGLITFEQVHVMRYGRNGDTE
jgi:uncharacterized protein